MTPRLEFAIEAAVQAGRRTLAYFQSGTEVEYKQDQTPVTLADKEAEAVIRRMIEAKYPSETVLGEEEGLTGHSLNRWVVDPIDGTKSFVSGVPLYAVLLGWEVAGEPELGVCYFPALDEVVYAQRGSGAYWNGRCCRVSARTTLEGAVLTSASPLTCLGKGRLDGVLALSRKAMALRTWCDAYGHMLVATGRVEAMIDPLVNRWDISAIAPIVREAGGSFTRFDGSPELGDEAVSCAPALVEQVLGAFRT